MNDNDVEDQLRRAMRPIDPPAGFAERVMRALPAREATAPVVVLARPMTPRPGAWRRFSTPMALAASLVVAVLMGQQIAIQHEQREGEAASRELMQALRVTSQKLDIAYQAVNSPPSDQDRSGRAPGEENRS